MVAELLDASAGYLFCLYFSGEVMVGEHKWGVGLTEAAAVLHSFFFRNDVRHTLSFCFRNTPLGLSCFISFLYLQRFLDEVSERTGSRLFTVSFMHMDIAAFTPLLRQDQRTRTISMGAREQSVWFVSCLPTPPVTCMVMRRVALHIHERFTLFRR